MRPRNRPATWIAALWGIARERGGGVLITARHATTPDTTQGTRISLAGVRGPASASTGSFPAEGEKSAATPVEAGQAHPYAGNRLRRR